MKSLVPSSAAGDQRHKASPQAVGLEGSGGSPFSALRDLFASEECASPDVVWVWVPQVLVVSRVADAEQGHSCRKRCACHPETISAARQSTTGWIISPSPSSGAFIQKPEVAVIAGEQHIRGCTPLLPCSEMRNFSFAALPDLGFSACWAVAGKRVLQPEVRAAARAGLGGFGTRWPQGGMGMVALSRSFAFGDWN